MINEARGGIRTVLLTLSGALFLAANAHAMVLGDIDVKSHLGQPLSARIEIADLQDAEAAQLKIRMAGGDDYQKLGLQYPEGYKFRFQLVKQTGASWFIRVSTPQAVDDPFINLLIEISASAGKLIKTYTFLLDPPGNAPVLSDGVMQTDLPASAEPRSVAVEAGKQAALPVPKKRHKTLRVNHPVAVRSTSQVRDGGRQMKLSMSLSISKYDPRAPVGTDALQEELIVKEKLLTDLKLQISEMEGMLKVLNDQHAPVSGVVASAASTTPASVATASEVKANQTLPEAAPLAPVPVRSQAALRWQWPAAIALLSIVLGLLWYRKRLHQYRQGIFDDLPDEATPVVHAAFSAQPSEASPDHVTQHLPAFEEKFAEPMFAADPAPLAYPEEVAPFAELPVDASIYSERRSEPVVPPEYAILMEANRHLRNGDEVLAQKALIRAIEVNPKNAYGYLALLRIYQQQDDKTGFANIAQKLKETGDEASFEEAAVLGRAFDPDNPLYLSGVSD
jgi:hypothetical protein